LVAASPDSDIVIDSNKPADNIYAGDVGLFTMRYG
jgi:hypothetical protein